MLTRSHAPAAHTLTRSHTLSPPLSPPLAQVLNKLGDVEGLLSLYLSNNHWPDALALIKQNPQFAPRVYLPYAQWLVEQDRFEEAQAAFKQAGQASKSLELLRTLTHNAVLEARVWRSSSGPEHCRCCCCSRPAFDPPRGQHRYNDAGHYLWTLAKETLATAPERPSKETLKEYEECRRTAEQYYGYHSIHKCTDADRTGGPDSCCCFEHAADHGRVNST